MNWFKRKQSEDSITYEMPHEHVWKDFPWYMDVHYSGMEKTAQYEIIEPYVCITCGERKDVCLEHREWAYIDADTRKKYYEKVKEKYKDYLRPRAVVEDMINNVLLVRDTGRLNMIETMLGTPHMNCGTSSTMKAEKTKEEPKAPRIEL